MTSLKELVFKYEKPGPRYTSYPTAPHFSTNADKARLAELAVNKGEEMCLYVHIPFCKSRCYFCGCTSQVCTDSSECDKYLKLIERELAIWRTLGLGKKTLKQISFGGGTPNFLESGQIDALGEILGEYFKKATDCEFSVELDPRTLTKQKVEAFARIGLNRASIGIQDTNPATQEVIGRVQPMEQNKQAAAMLAESGITALNCDVMYGLPYQTHETFQKTLDDVLSLNPTRISLFGYAHVPWIKPAQKRLEQTNALPNPEERVALFEQALKTLEEAGFVYMGLDHFAKPSDPLFKARANKTLHRNFQGYTTCAGIDVFALGLTSISDTKTSYRQNFKTFPEYEAALMRGTPPIERGIILDSEDILRRGVIMDIMCALEVDYRNYGVDFEEKFSAAIGELAAFERDGLVEFTPRGFRVTKLGALFLRNIAMLFDGRLGTKPDGSPAPRYSKTL